MRREIVERRSWVDAGTFNRMFAACNVIPGPSSTELAMFLGYRLAGWRGLGLAAAGFITPAMVIMLVLAAVYERYAGTRIAHLVLHGVRPVVVAIVVWAAIDLGRKLLERRVFLLLVPLALIAYAVGVNPVFVLALCGAIAVVLHVGPRLRRSGGFVALAVSPWWGVHADRLPAIFLTFLKIGAVSFGSGYVLFAFLQSDFVQGLRWLTPAQLVDAVAIGQVTPGPVFTTATFLGYLFAGVPGALVATAAIFLPGLVLVPVLDRVMNVVESRAALRVFLDAINAGVIGLIVAVAIALARASLLDALTVALAVAAFAVIQWKPLAAPAVVACGAIAGLVSGI